MKRHPVDHGPIYFETDLTAIVKEPLNMASAALFIALALYWLIQLRKQPEHRFQYWLNWGLLVGGIGGTLFHGFRWHFIFLAMDFIPIIILTLATAIHYWLKILTRRIWLVLPITLLFALRFVLMALKLDLGVQIALSYTATAVFIILPMLLYLIKQQGAHGLYILFSVIFFFIAIYCRTNDYTPFFTGVGGGHWLWHVFGAGSVAALQVFMYRSRQQSLHT